jgi:putative MATE family efflux protein
MTATNASSITISRFFSLFKQALRGEEQDYTTGSIRKAVFLLAIPMILEMAMESVFAIVDAFFVGRLGPNALAVVGLTESVLTIVYSLAIGLSMAATAMVARRVGEKNPDAAGRAGMQALLLSVFFTVIISALGFIFAGDILQLMGASPEVQAMGTSYTRIVMGGSIVILLLFLINGIFRGAGDASIAMRSLTIANICNIILCPVLIYGFDLGLPGAAIATTTGRGIGVCYQLYHLFKGKGVIHIKRAHLIPDWPVMKSLLNIAWTATAQFIIASASWIFLARIVAQSGGSNAAAGYTLAIRVLLFFILPAWGLSNAAATLVGQNLGAKQPERAEESVWKTARYSAIFMAFVTVFFLLAGSWIISLMNNDTEVVKIASQALRIMTLGYIGYGVGMVVMQAFNGAGDSRTPTWINLFGFWAFQVPMAYILAVSLNMGPKGAFIAMVCSEVGITIASVLLFKRGKWKTIKL